MELKFVICSIPKVGTCICHCKKNDRVTQMPIVETRIYRLALIQILNMNIVNLIYFSLFGHMFPYSISRFHT